MPHCQHSWRWILQASPLGEAGSRRLTDEGSQCFLNTSSASQARHLTLEGKAFRCGGSTHRHSPFTATGIARACPFTKQKSPVPFGTGLLIKLMFLIGNYCSFFSLGRTATTAAPESIRNALHRAMLLSSPVLGLAEACAVVRIWKVVLSFSPSSVTTVRV